MWNFFSAHPGAWEIHYSIFSFHTQIPLLFSALFTLTPAWLNSEVEISGKRNTQSPSISFWQHRIIGKTFFLCLWYDQINVSNTNDGVISQKKSNPGRPGEIFFGHPQRRKHSYFFLRPQPASSGQEHYYIISVVRTKLETTKVWLSLRVFKFERLMIYVRLSI